MASTSSVSGIADSSTTVSPHLFSIPGELRNLIWLGIVEDEELHMNLEGTVIRPSTFEAPCKLAQAEYGSLYAAEVLVRATTVVIHITISTENSVILQREELAALMRRYSETSTGQAREIILCIHVESVGRCNLSDVNFLLPLRDDSEDILPKHQIQVLWASSFIVHVGIPAGVSPMDLPDIERLMGHYPSTAAAAPSEVILRVHIAIVDKFNLMHALCLLKDRWDALPADHLVQLRFDTMACPDIEFRALLESAKDVVLGDLYAESEELALKEASATLEKGAKKRRVEERMIELAGNMCFFPTPLEEKPPLFSNS